LGKRFDRILFAIHRNVASSNGNSSWRGSEDADLYRRNRLGWVRCPLATSCLIGETLAFDTIQREIGAPHVVNAKLVPVRNGKWLSSKTVPIRTVNGFLQA